MFDFDKTIKKSFTIDFCQRLEYHLCQAFRNSGGKDLKWIWCDGVEVPDAGNQTIESLIETKEIVTLAWIGATGQDKYKMVIRLGNKSLEKCLKGLSMVKCLPSDKSIDWVDIDIENKSITLQLK